MNAFTYRVGPFINSLSLSLTLFQSISVTRDSIRLHGWGISDRSITVTTFGNTTGNFVRTDYLRFLRFTLRTTRCENIFLEDESRIACLESRSFVLRFLHNKSRGYDFLLWNFNSGSTLNRTARCNLINNSYFANCSPTEVWTRHNGWTHTGQNCSSTVCQQKCERGIMARSTLDRTTRQQFANRSVNAA